jgi:hypothetical protein
VSDVPIKLARCKKKKNWTWEAPHLVNGRGEYVSWINLVKIEIKFCFGLIFKMVVKVQRLLVFSLRGCCTYITRKYVPNSLNISLIL